MIGIKGTKWGKRNREDRDNYHKRGEGLERRQGVTEREGRYRWKCW